MDEDEGGRRGRWCEGGGMLMHLTWRPRNSHNYIGYLIVLVLIKFINPVFADDLGNPCELFLSKATGKIDLMLLLHEDRGMKLIFDNDNYSVFQHPSDGSVWTVTKFGQLADPAIICRYPFKSEDGSWHTKIVARCGGDKDACDSLVKEFQ